jgi:hypothetical protein
LFSFSLGHAWAAAPACLTRQVSRNKYLLRERSVSSLCGLDHVVQTKDVCCVTARVASGSSLMSPCGRVVTEAAPACQRICQRFEACLWVRRPDTDVHEGRGRNQQEEGIIKTGADTGKKVARITLEVNTAHMITRPQV